jgi:Acyl-coenzyme A:6-aminopenicillanic acid acyl-transferase
MRIIEFSQSFSHAVKNSIDKQFTSKKLIKQKIEKFIHKYPTIIKCTQISLAILGAATIASLPLTCPVLGIAAIALALTGGILAAVSLIAYNILDLTIAPTHAMKEHVFKPASCEGGRLYYQGDVPILELQSDDSNRAGFAHGFLMAPYIGKVIKRMDFAMRFGALVGHSLPKAHEMPKVMAEIRRKLPEEYLKELEGIVEGYNKWAKERRWLPCRKITLDELLLVHLMPDTLHFSPRSIERSLESTCQRPQPVKEKNAKPFETVACMVIIDRDKNEGMTLARNMDWYSFGLLGSYSLIINRKHSDGRHSTAEIGMPGFVGTLTGMNSQGLSFAMNVCSGNTDSVRGMPAAFFNRICLEKCSNVKEVEEVISSAIAVPLGSYHISVADPIDAKAFHLYQGRREQPHVIRSFEEGSPLIVANFNYRADGTKGGADIACSEARHQILDQYYQLAVRNIPNEELHRAELAAEGLKLPIVNNQLTTHTVIMNPSSKEMKVAFDNAYSASAKLHDVDTNLLFRVDSALFKKN